MGLEAGWEGGLAGLDFSVALEVLLAEPVLMPGIDLDPVTAMFAWVGILEALVVGAFFIFEIKLL